MTPGVTALEPYVLGGEPAVSRPPRVRAPLSPCRDDILEPYAADVAAGVSDAVIARLTGATTHQVAHWRRRRGLLRAGRPAAESIVRGLAVELAATQFRPIAAAVAKSPVQGCWEPPEYVVRVPLQYTDFAEAISLLVGAGWHPSRIAAALGVREKDVHHALALFGAAR